MIRYLVAAVLTVGFFLRLWGVDYGLPFALIGDEVGMLGGALRMLELRSLIPALHPEAMSILYYPVVLPYLYLAAMTPVLGGLYVMHGLPQMDQFGLIVLGNLDAIWLTARLTSVAMSAATLYVIYRIGAALFRSPLAGLVAASAMTFDYLHIMAGHTARHWSATVFLIWAVAWLSLRYFERPDMRKAVVIGLLAGAGFGVSYIGALGLGFGVVSHLGAWREGRTPLLGRDALTIAGCCIALIVLTTLLYPQPIIRLGTNGILPFAERKTMAGWWNATVFYATAIRLSNPALLVAAAAGLSAAVLTRRWHLVGGALFLMLFFTAFLYCAMPLEDRYIVPLSPVLALLGGFAVSDAWQRLQRIPWAQAAVGLLAAAVLAYPAAVSFRAAQLLAQPDTRLVAKKWLEDNLPADAAVAMNVDVVRLTPSLDALNTQKQLDPTSLNAGDRLRLARGAAGGTAERNVLNLWQLSPAVLKAINSEAFADRLLDQGYRYYVADGFGARQAPELHQSLMKRSKEIARFSSGSSAFPPPYLFSRDLVPYAMHHLFSSVRLGPEVVVMQALEVKRSN